MNIKSAWNKLSDLERNLLVGINVMNFPVDNQEEWKKSFEYHHELGLWNYSTNPRQAYDVIEKLIIEGYIVEFKNHSTKKFLCKIALSPEMLSNAPYSEAESFQEAVCLAAIRAKGVLLEPCL
ncbi:BC1872 family protein [Paenibacillus anseongense]|uniref:BC1872 family protein n=1 Tax=Paenibacillus anseongense TaxID=2682845 RepID=UPI002DB686AD|nr:hypothetical protein [Paenibacillus anseongense]MEC0269692.1 hypothetical protein [Paenibacillus anseongense]